jgi:hypothetical protein
MDDNMEAAASSSSVKGKMPVPPTAKHADAEGYEMPW